MAERSGGDPPRSKHPLVELGGRSNTKTAEIPLVFTPTWWIPRVPHPRKHYTQTATKSLLPLLAGAVLAEGAEGAEGAAPGLGDAASRALFAGAQALTINYYLFATTYY